MDALHHSRVQQAALRDRGQIKNLSVQHVRIEIPIRKLAGVLNMQVDELRHGIKRSSDIYQRGIRQLHVLDRIVHADCHQCDIRINLIDFFDQRIPVGAEIAIALENAFHKSGDYLRKLVQLLSCRKEFIQRSGHISAMIKQLLKHFFQAGILANQRIVSADISIVHHIVGSDIDRDQVRILQCFCEHWAHFLL